MSAVCPKSMLCFARASYHRLLVAAQHLPWRFAPSLLCLHLLYLLDPFCVRWAHHFLWFCFVSIRIWFSVVACAQTPLYFTKTVPSSIYHSPTSCHHHHHRRCCHRRRSHVLYNNNANIYSPIVPTTARAANPQPHPHLRTWKQDGRDVSVAASPGYSHRNLLPLLSPSQ
jgi:hypothetical protein